MGGRGGTEMETDSLGSASSIMGEAFSFFFFFFFGNWLSGAKETTSGIVSLAWNQEINLGNISVLPPLAPRRHLDIVQLSESLSEGRVVKTW